MSEESKEKENLAQGEKIHLNSSEFTEIINESQTGALGIAQIESARANAHSGSAGGDDESIQIEAMDAVGNKIIASRQSGITEKQISDQESISQSHLDLKVAAASNSILEPVANLRDYAESLPTGDPLKDDLRELARKQYKELTKPPAYEHLENDDDAGSFQIIKRSDNSILINTGIGLDAKPDESSERLIGATIGVVEGIGATLVDLARVADFAAAVLIADEKRVTEMGSAFIAVLGKSIEAGVNIFQKSYDYLYEIGFQGDAAKPFKDLVTLGCLLDKKWRELPPKEQERLKFRLITDLATGMIPIEATNKMKAASSLDEVLVEAGRVANELKVESAVVNKATGELVDDLIIPAMKELKPGERWIGAPIGNWKVSNERVSARVVVQKPEACASASGEMLCHGLKNQDWFIDKIGAPAAPDSLAKALTEVTGEPWVYGGVWHEPIEKLMRQSPWGAVLSNYDVNMEKGRYLLKDSEFFQHIVVVDGRTKEGSILIRDPAGGLEYEMTELDFRSVCDCAVIREKIK